MNMLNAKDLKVVFLTLMVVFITLGAACQIPENNQGKMVNRPAPDFTLKDLNGNSVRLSALLGKTVFFNFWATTCPPCVAEMPLFQELYNAWQDRSDVVFLSINLGEGAEKVRLFAERHRLTFPIFLDLNWEAGQVYQVHYTPSSCLVDKTGIIRFFEVGAFPDKAALDQKLAGFVSAQP